MYSSIYLVGSVNNSMECPHNLLQYKGFNELFTKLNSLINEEGVTKELQADFVEVWVYVVFVDLLLCSFDKHKNSLWSLRDLVIQCSICRSVCHWLRGFSWIFLVVGLHRIKVKQKLISCGFYQLAIYVVYLHINGWSITLVDLTKYIVYVCSKSPSKMFSNQDKADFLFYWLNSDSHPDVFWHRLNGRGAYKNALRKVFSRFFLCIFYVKAKWNSLQIIQK